MWAGAAMFVFLAAGAIALFAFLSVAVWAGAQAEERKARDKFALLKALAEHPGESSQRVLERLREEEEAAAARKQREERRGYLVGGLVCMAVGAALAVMLTAIEKQSGMWTVGLVPFLIGVVLAGVGALMRPSR